MEDCVVAAFALPASEGEVAVAKGTQLGYFGVFDGHGGSQVATFCNSHLLERLLKRVPSAGALAALAPEELEARIRSTFMEMDKASARLPPLLVQPPATCCVKQGEYMKDIDCVGSTASTVLVTAEHIVFAHAGDSRALLVRDGKVFFATKDHTPANEDETERIEDAGGFVEAGRVDGLLGVARALGDGRFKEVEGLAPELQKVTADPDITTIARDPKDQFLLIASDGLWNVMSNDDICDYLVKFLLQDQAEIDIVCEVLLDECVNKRYSGDNTSVIVVDLAGSFPAEGADASLDTATPATPPTTPAPAATAV